MQTATQGGINCLKSIECLLGFALKPHSSKQSHLGAKNSAEILSASDLIAFTVGFCPVHWFDCIYTLGSDSNIDCMYIRVGPQSQNWSDQQNTLDPTGSIH